MEMAARLSFRLTAFSSGSGVIKSGNTGGKLPDQFGSRRLNLAQGCRMEFDCRGAADNRLHLARDFYVFPFVPPTPSHLIHRTYRKRDCCYFSVLDLHSLLSSPVNSPMQFALLGQSPLRGDELPGWGLIRSSRCTRDKKSD